jgi:hypothetical protein
MPIPTPTVSTYTYALSKRTNLNAVLTRFNNKDSFRAFCAPFRGLFLWAFHFHGRGYHALTWRHDHCTRHR